jgi:hypothetical protein
LGMRVNLDCRATTTSRKVCGGALWCTIHQSGGVLGKETLARRFFLVC